MEIEIKDVIKSYGEHTILDIKKFLVMKGDLIGLIGNNGAGKTTLFRLILDLIKADKGQVLSRQSDVSKTEYWKEYTSAYLDTSFLIEFLTPEEYFNFIAKSYNVQQADLKNELLRFKNFMNGEILGKRKYIRNFSAGNQQKIGIIGSMIPRPKILILDEPFNFLDPSSQYFLRDHLNFLNKEFETTILVSSHNLTCILDISTRIILLEKGNIIKDICQIETQSKEELNMYFKINNTNDNQLKENQRFSV